MKSGHGGKRAGAGKPKGVKWPSTLTKEAGREVLRQMFMKSLQPLVQAQIVNALGIGHLYTRDKAGKFTKVESQAQVDKLLQEGTEGEHYWIFTKDPSQQSFSDLANRALDKPKEQAQDLNLTGDEALIAALLVGRQRARHSTKD